MKKFIIPTLVLIIWATSLPAQITREKADVFDYYQIITPDKVWNIEYGMACPEAEGTHCWCYLGLGTIKTGDIKIFNGKEYYELLQDDNPNQPLLTYVREEEGQVYFYTEKCDKEYLLYDFNLNAGDEVFLVDPYYPTSFYNEDNPCELTEQDMNLYRCMVTEVDSIEYNHVKRKMLKVETGNPYAGYDIWVEGIGCMRGITYQITSQMTGVRQLKDCYEADELIFVNEDPQYCWVAACEAVNDLTAETCNPDCVLLTWSQPESDLQIEGYRIFRNEQPLNEELLAVTTYIDENLPDGIYEYCVIAYYTNGCISDPSNCVTEQITVSIDDFQNNLVHVFNDGNNMLHIVNARGISFTMYDLLGRKVKFILPEDDHVILNLSYLPKGLYVVVNQIQSLTFKIIIR